MLMITRTVEPYRLNCRLPLEIRNSCCCLVHKFKNSTPWKVIAGAGGRWHFFNPKTFIPNPPFIIFHRVRNRASSG